MPNLTVTVATVLAVVLAAAALVTLSMGLHVASGTFFVFTAFAIYIRETNK